MHISVAYVIKIISCVSPSAFKVNNMYINKLIELFQLESHLQCNFDTSLKKTATCTKCSILLPLLMFALFSATTDTMLFRLICFHLRLIFLNNFLSVGYLTTLSLASLHRVDFFNFYVYNISQASIFLYDLLGTECDWSWNEGASKFVKKSLR
jgi:hypothetical protein